MGQLADGCAERRARIRRLRSKQAPSDEDSVSQASVAEAGRDMHGLA